MNPLFGHPLGCFFCGVDSRTLLYFFIVFAACLVLGSICFLIWAISKGDFRNIEQAKFEIFNDPEKGTANSVPLPKPKPK